MKKHIKIELNSQAEKYTKAILNNDNYSSNEKRRARILLKLHENNVCNLGLLSSEIAKSENVSQDTICNIKRRYFETRSVPDTVRRKKRRANEKRNRLPVESKNMIISIAKSIPPEGKTRWTYRMISNFYNNAISSNRVSHTTVMTILRAEKIVLK
jgi:transposase